MKCGTWALVLILFSLAGRAQRIQQNEIDLSRLADDLTGFPDEEANYEELHENQVQLLSNPLDLNTASADELRMLYALTESQIGQFLQYRKEQGGLLSHYELQVIPEFDLETIYKLQPFVQVADPQSELNKTFLKRMVTEGTSYVITRYERTIQPKRGFTLPVDDTNKFNGSENKYYLRFRTSKPGDFSFGITAEKDQGEQWRWDPAKHQFGIDYFSFHAQVQQKKRIKNLIMGDYQCQFAQGLILGGAFGLGKGAETITTAYKSNVGFLPYTSVNESGYYRGVAATYRVWKNIFASFFYSSTRRDASVNSGNSDSTTISSLLSTGLHRNDREHNNRKSLPEQSCGVVFNVKKGNLDAGTIVQAIRFGHALDKNISSYNQFVFRGDDNINTGVFINYSIYNFNFFSEVAKSVQGGTAAIAGVISSLYKNVDLSISFRNYEKDYHPFYANAFGEGSQPQNETGFYWGIKFQWSRKLTLSGYADFFKFPWLGFRRYAPSAGHEWLLRLNYKLNRKGLIFFQAREEMKSRNTGQEENLYKTETGAKRNYWINFDYSINPVTRFKSRVQYSTYRIGKQNTAGLVFMQDISFSKGRFQFTARYALFDSEDFDNRHYAYENDVWLAYSLPAYDGVGVRNYVVLEYKMNKRLSFWFRYSRTRYIDRNEIGSGQDLISGNLKSDIKIQLMVKL